MFNLEPRREKRHINLVPEDSKIDPRRRARLKNPLGFALKMLFKKI